MKAIFSVTLALLVASCSSGSSQSEASSSATTGECSDGDYSSSVGVTEGAAGTSYTTLIITNVSNKECDLEGVPSAQPVIGADRRTVGMKSGENLMPGRGGTVRLAPGDVASVIYGVGTASNYPTEDCEPVISDGVIVKFSQPISMTAYFPMREYDVCTKVVSTYISGIAAGLES